jgi:hypothetical protein
MSTTDRVIIGVTLLLPFLGKLYKVGRGLMAADEMVRIYGLSSREAAYTYRFALGLGPGTRAAGLFSSAAADIRAGRSVNDPKILADMEAALKDIGMSDQDALKAVRDAPAPAAPAPDIDVDLSKATRPQVTGGARPRIDDIPVPTRRRPRLDIEDILRLPGETQRQAVARVKNVIGQRLSDTKLGPIWEKATEDVVAGRSLESATRQEMFDLYDKVRNRFWDLVKKDPAASQFLEDSGFAFEGGRAPLLKVTDPSIPIQERRVSLDHELEKALAGTENYKKAIDVKNLILEFQNPNSNRETVQVKFKLRSNVGGDE